MEHQSIQIEINGMPITVPKDTLIVEACKTAGFPVPTLCHLPGLCSNASCGVCVVEVGGAKTLVRSCVQKVSPGMKIVTNSSRVLQARKTVVELLLANHPEDCLSCLRNQTCELQALAEQVGVRRGSYRPTKKFPPPDDAGATIVRDNTKCILCGRCVAACREIQGVGAIDFMGRGLHTHIGTFMDRSLAQSVCVSCGQCTLVCPTGALTERDESDPVLAAIHDPDKVVVVQTAPAIRSSLGEALGMPAGSLVTGSMVAALRRLGFDYVFDTQFAADLTIMEEGTELLHRISNGGILPMITSCSPGWINFIETFYPELLPHLSTCKSPQQMFGAIAKSWWAKKMNIDPARIVVVSIMPCTAKKYEARRPEMRDAYRWWNEQGYGGLPFDDVDYALTTRELARMIRRVGIDFSLLPQEDFDAPLGLSTGAATIFASTGGVMEAALRTAYELVTHKALPRLEFETLRGMEGIKTAQVELDGTSLKVGVAHSLKNARIVLEELRSGKSPYTFIEIMSCPGGCVGGGGQPLRTDWNKRELRQRAIYQEDQRLPLRKSHENPAVQELYREFLGEPLGQVSHELLHTSYGPRRV